MDIRSKHFSGPTYGSGPSRRLTTSGEAEFGGVHRSAPNPKPSIVKGAKDARDGNEGKVFDPMAKGYAGPENLNFKPVDKGVRNPDDIQRSTHP